MYTFLLSLRGAMCTVLTRQYTQESLNWGDTQEDDRPHSSFPFWVRNRLCLFSWGDINSGETSAGVHQDSLVFTVSWRLASGSLITYPAPAWHKWMKILFESAQVTLFKQKTRTGISWLYFHFLTKLSPENQILRFIPSLYLQRLTGKVKGNSRSTLMQTIPESQCTSHLFSSKT